MGDEGGPPAPDQDAEWDEDKLERVEAALLSGEDPLSEAQRLFVTYHCHIARIDPANFLDVLVSQMRAALTAKAAIEVYDREVGVLVARSGSPQGNPVPPSTRSKGALKVEMEQACNDARSAVDAAGKAVMSKEYDIKSEAQVHKTCASMERRMLRLDACYARIKEAIGADVPMQQGLTAAIEPLQHELALTLAAKEKWYVRYQEVEKRRVIERFCERLIRAQRLTASYLEDADELGRASKEDMLREGSDFSQEMSIQRQTAREEAARLTALYLEDKDEINDMADSLVEVCFQANRSVTRSAIKIRRGKIDLGSDQGGSVTKGLREGHLGAVGGLPAQEDEVTPRREAIPMPFINSTRALAALPGHQGAAGTAGGAGAASGKDSRRRSEIGPTPWRPKKLRVKPSVLRRPARHTSRASESSGTPGRGRFGRNSRP